MSIKASVFAGPTNVMALGHPFGGPAFADSQGVPIGIDIDTREVVCVDFWQLKMMKVINTKFGIVFGDVGFGKSTLLKTLAIRMMTMSAGYSQMRTLINDYKPEADESEYGRFSEVAQSTIFKMADMSFNPFEQRLFLTSSGSAYELGILDMAKTIAEYSNKKPLEGYEFTALRIAMSVMLTVPGDFWDVPLLFKIVGSLTVDQINRYFLDNDDKLKTQLETRIKNLHSENKEAGESAETASEQLQKGSLEMMHKVGSLAQAKDNYFVHDIQVAGAEVQRMGYDLLNGPIGPTIGTKNSLYELYTQRATTKDWRGLLPEVQTFSRIIDTNFRISMIENNRADMLPFIELDDEKHKGVDDMAYLRVNAFSSEIARSTHLVSLSATHRPDSIRKGAIGSEQWKLGETILNNQGYAFLGHQQNRPEILNELGDRYRLGAMKDDLPLLPPYTFIASFGATEPVRKIRTFVTPMEFEMIQTDSATDKVMVRPNILSSEDLKLYAEANGISYVGGEG